MLRLIRCSQVKNSEDIPNFINSIQLILEKTKFLTGKVKFHYNGELNQNFFLLCEKINIPIIIKTNYKQYIENIEILEKIAPDGITLRDSINFYEEMLEESRKEHSFKLVLQFRANGNKEDREKINKIQQEKEIYDWKINPQNIKNIDELKQLSEYLKQNINNLPSNIKTKGNKEQEISFWLTPEGKYENDVSIYFDGEEIGGKDIQRNNEYNDYYKSIKVISENLY